MLWFLVISYLLWQLLLRVHFLMASMLQHDRWLSTADPPRLLPTNGWLQSYLWVRKLNCFQPMAGCNHMMSSQFPTKWQASCYMCKRRTHKCVATEDVMNHLISAAKCHHSCHTRVTVWHSVAQRLRPSRYTTNIVANVSSQSLIERW